MNEKESKRKAVNIFAIAFSLLVVASIAVTVSILKAPAVASQIKKQPIASKVDPAEISIEAPATQNKEAPEAITKNENKANPDSATKVENKSELDADEVIVTVNGTEITQSQLDKRTSPQLAVLAKNGQATNEEAQNKLRQNILNEIMRERLVKAAIESEKIEVSNNEINNRLSELAAKQNMTIGQLFAQAAKQRINSNQIEGQVRAGIGFEKLIDTQTDSNSLVITEEDAKKYYDDNISQFIQPQRIRASHILFGSGQRDASGKPIEADETTNAEFEGKAREVAKELTEGGDFEELVRVHSVCQTKNNGGDLGYFTKDTNMDKDFIEAAFKLNKGETSDIVQTQFGYHIIKVTDSVQVSTISFDKAKAAIVKWLTNQKKQALVDDYIESLSSKAEIVWVQNK